MKKQLLYLIIILALTGNAFGKYSGGNGEPNDPYEINDVNDLLQLSADANDYNKCFILVNDINLADHTFTTAIVAPDLNNTLLGFQGTAFDGVFDGNNCNILNFTIDTGGLSSSYLGLFGHTDTNAFISNLGVRDVNITTGSASFCLGGLVGLKRMGDISNCSVTGAVTGGDDLRSVGGLVGNNEKGSISNCKATSIVIGGDDSWYLGNLVGFSYNSSSIYECYATGSITGAYYVGGLVGESKGSITNCYATGSVSGDNYVAGLLGYNHDGSVMNCYSTGVVECSGYAVGGLVGMGLGSVEGSFWDMESSQFGTSHGGTGLSTAEMQVRSTFAGAGWDMINVWDIGENQTYPFLRTHLPSDINKDGITNFLDLAILAEHWLESM